MHRVFATFCLAYLAIAPQALAQNCPSLEGDYYAESHPPAGKVPEKFMVRHRPQQSYSFITQRENYPIVPGVGDTACAPVFWGEDPYPVDTLIVSFAPGFWTYYRSALDENSQRVLLVAVQRTPQASWLTEISILRSFPQHGVPFYYDQAVWNAANYLLAHPELVLAQPAAEKDEELMVVVVPEQPIQGNEPTIGGR